MEQKYRGRGVHQPVPSPRPPRPHASVAPRVPGPLIARFLEEDDTDYLVGDPWGDRTARVLKRRARPEMSSPEQRRRTSSERLLRWSSYALIGAVCGGIVGIALGAAVILATLVRLARLSSRIQRWRRRDASGDRRALPAEATRERIQLLAALGQGLLSMLLGGGILYAILMMR